MIKRIVVFACLVASAPIAGAQSPGTTTQTDSSAAPTTVSQETPAQLPDANPAPRPLSGAVQQFDASSQQYATGAQQQAQFAPFKLNTSKSTLLGKNRYVMLQPKAGDVLLRAGTTEAASPFDAIQHRGTAVLGPGYVDLFPRFGRENIGAPLPAEVAKAAPLSGFVDEMSRRPYLPMQPFKKDFEGFADKQGNLPLSAQKNVPSFLNSELNTHGAPRPTISEQDMINLELRMRAHMTMPTAFLWGRWAPMIHSDAESRVSIDMDRQMKMQLSGSKQNQLDTKTMEQMMDSELAHAIKQPQRLPDVDKEVQAQLARSKPQIDAELARAETALEAVIRRPKDVDMDVAGELSTESTILWDRWYATLARLAEPQLLDSLEKHGNPAGANTISITVWPNNRLQATLLKGQNPDFDTATLQAYRALDGDPSLSYPAGSRRRLVTFTVDNKHRMAGSVSGVNNKTYVGDKEVQTRKWITP